MKRVLLAGLALCFTSCASSGDRPTEAIVEDARFWATELRVLSEEAAAAGHEDLATDIFELHLLAQEVHAALALLRGGGSPSDLGSTLHRLMTLTEALLIASDDDPQRQERIRLIGYGLGLALRRAGATESSP